MRTLGLDLGDRRIGLALSDPAGRTAVPLTTITRKSDQQAIRGIADIARQEGVERLVVGEPLNLDGSRGPAAERARSFSRKLAAECELPCLMVNESLTSVEAKRRLREAGVDPRRHPERVDALSAQIILQQALDQSPPGGRP